MTKKYSVNISDRLLAEIIKMQKDKQADKSQSCNDNSKETQFDKFTPSTMKHIIEHYLTYCPHDFMPRFFFDKKGDSHYDNISAFIKSMRGSDPDAAIFYLARALNGGEDPMFLARRIVIAASEDVGMANPNALILATSAMEAVHMVGMPEARIILAEAAVYVATSKKSNASYLAINQALEDVANKDTGEVPMHIRNAPAEGMEKEGYHVGYKYPHDYPGHYVEQQYLPDKMLGTKYYIKDENIPD
jgi:putative ATPase